MSINLSDLEVRGIYRLRARNLTMGVWTGQSWIGIREKFGDFYLDQSEVPGDDRVIGSARATEKIGELPDEVETRARMPTVCDACGHPVEFVPDRPDQRVPGKWVHKTYVNFCEKARPIGRQYQPLYDFLESLGGKP